MTGMKNSNGCDTGIGHCEKPSEVVRAIDYLQERIKALEGQLAEDRMYNLSQKSLTAMLTA